MVASQLQETQVSYARSRTRLDPMLKIPWIRPCPWYANSNTGNRQHPPAPRHGLNLLPCSFCNFITVHAREKPARSGTVSFCTRAEIVQPLKSLHH
jgi:hypothetical protein